MKLIRKQETDFRLLAPDEPAARKAFEDAHPQRVNDRQELLANLNPGTISFPDDEDAADDADRDDAEDSETVEDSETAEEVGK